MSSQPAASNPTPDQAAEDAQYYRDVLHELIDIGTGLARGIPAKAAQPPAPAPAPAFDPIEAFDRVARAIRRTILLARKVAEPLPHAKPPGHRREAARKRIIRDVEDIIGHATNGSGGAEALNAEFHDRLDAPDLEDEIADRPVAEIVDDIVRDLGIHNHSGFTPYKRRTPEDVVRLVARAAHVPDALQPATAHPAPPQPGNQRGPRSRPETREPDPNRSG